MRMGNVEIRRVLDWAGRVVTREQMIPTSDRETWLANSEWLVPTFWDPDSDDAWMEAQSFVLRTPAHTILIDTGIGDGKSGRVFPFWNHLQTGYLDRLREVVRPEDIDIVVNTHLHQDHVGWNTVLRDGRWVPTFPNATYLLPRRDFEHWNPEGVEEPPGGRGDAVVFEDSILPVVHSGQAVFVDGEYIVDDYFMLLSAAGHTPGQHVGVLTAGSSSAIFVGDIFHTPMEILEPDQGASFDSDSELSNGSRRRVLERAASMNAAIVSPHFPAGMAPFVAEEGSKFKIVSWSQID